jgi:hypothetical protein
VEERLAAAPEALRERMLTALRGGNRESGLVRFPIPALRAAAEDLLSRAKSGPPTHDTALTLLAADALITLACEWEGGGGEG